MGNLIGTNPQQWVKTQVDLRQQLLGLENRDSETLSWITNNTAWIRAVSSVNITTETKSKELTGSSNYQGRELAKNFILFNSVTKVDPPKDGEQNSTPKYIQPSGIYSGGEDIFGSSYGFGGTNQGLVPPPGIESLDIKTYNRGSFRKATLKIKANSKQQFDIIEALYMHPGFTLLVEWGHTLYFSTRNETDVTSKEFTKANFNTTPFSQLLYSNGVDQDQILKGIDAERNASRGNYDGFFGKIVNFKWSFNEDNSYDIDVEVISLGDVIESLTINRIVKVSNPFPSDPPAETVRANPQQKEATAAETATANNNKQNGYLNKIKNQSSKLSFTAAKFLNQVGNGGNITGTGNDGKTSMATNAFQSFYQSLTKEDVKVISNAGLVVSSSGIEKKPVVTTTVDIEAESALESTLISGKNKSQFHTYLYSVYEKLKKNEDKGKLVNTYKLAKGENQKYPTVKVFSEGVYKKEDGTFLDDKELLSIKPQRIARKTTSSSNGSSHSKSIPVAAKNAPLQYVKFYHILQYIEENLLMYSKDKNGKPISYIKFDPNWQQTFCFTYPGHFSSDPNVCLIPFKVVDYKKDPENPNAKAEFGYLVEEELTSCFYDVLEAPGDNNFRSSISEYAGKLMFMHINIHFVVQCLESSTNENGVILLRFLEQLLNGIQDALGNINKLTVTFDHDNNMIRFMDDIPLDPKVITLVDKDNFSPQRKTLFNVYGWRPGKSKQFDTSAYLGVTGNPLPGYGNVQNGSFVYSVGLDSGITPQMATMLAIGAQSRGTSDLTNATAFNKFHEGLSDAIIPDKLSKAVLEDVVTTVMPESELKELDNKNTTQQRRQELKAKYERTYGKITDPLKIFQENIATLRAPQGLIDKFYQRGILVDSDIIDISKDISNATTRYIVSLLNDEGGVPPASGFIPFDLSLTMLGLSGIRMYERFYIDQNILPTSYNSNLSFIIKGVDHKVTSKGWETTITSLAAANNATTQTNANLSLPKNQIETANPPTSDN